MLEKGISSKQEFDNSQNNFNSSQSSLEEISALIKRLEAEVEKAKLDLSYTKIYAAENGKITHRTVEQGNYIQTAQPMFSIVPDKVWVVANFKETRVANMKKGQPVKIKIDTYGHKNLMERLTAYKWPLEQKQVFFLPKTPLEVT